MQPLPPPSRLALASLVCMAWAAPAQAQEVDLLDFFSGRLTGSGEFRALDGNNRTIQATYRGVVSGGILTLTSNLVFSDGEKQTVAWTFTRNPAGGYVARRREVDGPVNVATSGNRFSMSYQATVKAKDGQTYKLSFDETYTRTGPRTLSNSTQVTYFLLPLGTSSMTITKAAN